MAGSELMNEAAGSSDRVPSLLQVLGCCERGAGWPGVGGRSPETKREVEGIWPWGTTRPKWTQERRQRCAPGVSAAWSLLASGDFKGVEFLPSS